MSITEFLHARLAEDAAVAAAVQTRRDRDPQVGPEQQLTLWEADADSSGDPVVACDPARVVVDVEAKRALVAAAGDLQWHGSYAVRDVILKHLASVYADHPDYREEWRPR